MFFLRREPDERVVLLDAVTGEERGELAGASEINAHTEFVGQTVDIADDAAVEISIPVSDGIHIRAHTANAGKTLVIAGDAPPNSFWKRVREWFPSWDFVPSDSEAILAFYDTTSARRLCLVPRADDYVFSAGGRFVATYRDRDRQISIWDIPPRKPLGWFLGLAGVLLLLTLGGFWWQARRRKRKAALATEAIPCGT
jgi:hypothetical protein